MSRKGKATREYLETLSKDQVINLCLQFMFDAEISEQQLDQANERLKAISEPKYRIGQEVWCIAFEKDWNRYCIIKYKVKSYVPNNNGAMLELIESDCPRNICYYYESQVFDTSLEARAELRKLESKE